MRKSNLPPQPPAASSEFIRQAPSSDSRASMLAQRVRPLIKVGLVPRLLTSAQAAAYLGHPTEVLPTLPIRPIILGPKGAPRWDLRALDAYLDSESGLSQASSAPFAEEPEETLAAWRAQRAARDA